MFENVVCYLLKSSNTSQLTNPQEEPKFIQQFKC